MGAWWGRQAASTLAAFVREAQRANSTDGQQQILPAKVAHYENCHIVSLASALLAHFFPLASNALLEPRLAFFFPSTR